MSEKGKEVIRLFGELGSMKAVDLMTRTPYVFPAPELMDEIAQSMQQKVLAFSWALAAETDGLIAEGLKRLGWLAPCEGRKVYKGRADWLNIEEGFSLVDLDTPYKILDPWDGFEDGHCYRVIIDPLPKEDA